MWSLIYFCAATKYSGLPEVFDDATEQPKDAGAHNEDVQKPHNHHNHIESEQL